MQGDETRGPYSTTPRRSPSRELKKRRQYSRPASALAEKDTNQMLDGQQIKVFSRKKIDRKTDLIGQVPNLNIDCHSITHTDNPLAHSRLSSSNRNDDDEVGLIPRALHSIFRAFNSNSFTRSNCVLKVCFLEIYNDILLDLLNPVGPLESQ